MAAVGANQNVSRRCSRNGESALGRRYPVPLRSPVPCPCPCSRGEARAGPARPRTSRRRVVPQSYTHWSSRRTHTDNRGPKNGETRSPRRTGQASGAASAAVQGDKRHARRPSPGPGPSSSPPWRWRWPSGSPRSWPCRRRRTGTRTVTTRPPPTGSGKEAKGDRASVPRWLPDDAKHIEYAMRTTGGDRLLKAALPAATLPPTCEPHKPGAATRPPAITAGLVPEAGRTAPARPLRVVQRVSGGTHAVRVAGERGLGRREQGLTDRLTLHYAGEQRLKPLVEFSMSPRGTRRETDTLSGWRNGRRASLRC